VTWTGPEILNKLGILPVNLVKIWLFSVTGHRLQVLERVSQERREVFHLSFPRTRRLCRNRKAVSAGTFESWGAEGNGDRDAVCCGVRRWETVYCELRTVYCGVCAVNWKLCTVNCVFWTENCVLWTVYCELRTVYCGVCAVNWKLCTVNCVFWTENCVLWTVYFELRTVNCVLRTVYCELRTVFF